MGHWSDGVRSLRNDLVSISADTVRITYHVWGMGVKRFLLLILLIPAMDVSAQDEGADDAAEKKATVTDRFKQNPEFINPPAALLPPEQRRQVCRDLKSRFVSYYDSVYEVKDCARRLLSTTEVYRLTRRGDKIVEVDSSVMQALAEMPAAGESQELRPCRTFHRTYVTFSFVDVYWVEGCTKRLFPDWTTYEAHRGNSGRVRGPLLEVSTAELASMTDGQPFPSVMDNQTPLFDGAVIEVLPLDEACRGLMHRYVTYLERIYYIDRHPLAQGSQTAGCEKRPVDPVLFTKKHVARKLRLQELTSSQALSIPDGKPKSI